jgi:hypothetical protein
MRASTSRPPLDAMMRLSHATLERSLLEMAVPQVRFVRGVIVQRVHRRHWSVVGGAPELLLVAMDEFMRTAGLPWCGRDAARSSHRHDYLDRVPRRLRLREEQCKVPPCGSRRPDPPGIGQDGQRSPTSRPNGVGRVLWYDRTPSRRAGVPTAPSGCNSPGGSFCGELSANFRRTFGVPERRPSPCLSPFPPGLGEGSGCDTMRQNVPLRWRRNGSVR